MLMLLIWACVNVCHMSSSACENAFQQTKKNHTQTHKNNQLYAIENIGSHSILYVVSNFQQSKALTYHICIILKLVS